MRAKALCAVTMLAVLAAVIAFVPNRTPPQDENIAASPPSATEEPPPNDFATQFAAERRQALMRDARERALDSARADERERWESLKLRQRVAAREVRPLAQLQLAEQRAQLYESENVDRDWAPRTEAEILEKVSQTGVQVLDLRVECRTSICRLELLERADQRSISMPIAIALSQITDLQPSVPRQIESPTGARATVSYLARR